MRRRAPEFRRPARRRLSGWIWGLLGLFLVAGSALFVLHHRHQDPFLRPPGRKDSNQDECAQVGFWSKETRPMVEYTPSESSNFSQELLSSTSFARHLADQMTLAKAYMIIAKEHGNLQFAWELGNKIRNCQRLLSQAAVRGKPVTLEEVHPISSKLSQLIYKAQDSHYDISTMITTLKSHAQALEERAYAVSVQGSEFAQLAAKAMPKNIHCLNIKLTMQWFRNPAVKRLAAEQRNSPRLMDHNLYHFCVFSDNVLATSLVVNSTVSNADNPQQLVFHVVTNHINYWAMTVWFLSNDFKGCTIEVRSIEEFSWLNSSYSPLLKQLLNAEIRTYYFGGGSLGHSGEAKFRNPKFVSLLNHLRFYIPEIYPSLEKIVLLDDDVVVQKDLTPLFSLELHGNVNGAVETCLEAFHRFYKYLNFSNPLISSKFDPQACGWAFGMNVFDLVAWKKAGVTARYHYWQELNSEQMLWKTGTLPPGLLAFYGLVEPLDRRWHVLGLGYNIEIDDRLIQSAAVLHFNGDMKPWLRLGISRYKHLWDRYVNHTHLYLQDCVMQ